MPAPGKYKGTRQDRFKGLLISCCSYLEIRRKQPSTNLPIDHTRDSGCIEYLEGLVVPTLCYSSSRFHPEKSAFVQFPKCALQRGFVQLHGSKYYRAVAGIAYAFWPPTAMQLLGRSPIGKVWGSNTKRLLLESVCRPDLQQWIKPLGSHSDSTVNQQILGLLCIQIQFNSMEESLIAKANKPGIL